MQNWHIQSTLHLFSRQIKAECAPNGNAFYRKGVSRHPRDTLTPAQDILAPKKSRTVQIHQPHNLRRKTTPKIHDFPPVVVSRYSIREILASAKPQFQQTQRAQTSSTKMRMIIEINLLGQRRIQKRLRAAQKNMKDLRKTGVFRTLRTLFHTIPRSFANFAEHFDTKQARQVNKTKQSSAETKELRARNAWKQKFRAHFC